MAIKEKENILEFQQEHGNGNNECFIIMPISDPPEYEQGHFKRVYEDIFKPACEKIGLIPLRADDINGTSMIHLDILQRLLQSDMAICDLSSANPNVLFELGIRQAFDKPTVLVQEEGNESIFDIAPLKYCKYRKGLLYHEVIEDQEFLISFLKETKDSFKSNEKMNSIVNLLEITKASFNDNKDSNDPAFYQKYFIEEINQIKNDIHNIINNNFLTGTDLNNAIYGNILISINRLNDMIKTGTPNNIVLRNYKEIRGQIMDINDNEISSQLLKLLEDVKENAIK